MSESKNGVTKICNKCKLEFPLEQFGKDKFTKDGLTRYCLLCGRTNKKVPCPSCNQPKCRSAKLCDKCTVRSGESAPNWKGGKFGKRKYTVIYKPGHPTAGKQGYIAEHRFIMEQAIGRCLVPGENVHHKNGIKTDNRPENLELWSHTQPCGQRVEDKVAWAIEVLRLYKPEVLIKTQE